MNLTFKPKLMTLQCQKRRKLSDLTFFIHSTVFKKHPFSCFSLIFLILESNFSNLQRVCHLSPMRLNVFEAHSYVNYMAYYTLRTDRKGQSGWARVNGWFQKWGVRPWPFTPKCLGRSSRPFIPRFELKERPGGSLYQNQYLWAPLIVFMLVEDYNYPSCIQAKYIH